MTPDEWAEVPDNRKIRVGLNLLISDCEEVVKFLCEQSRQPGDQFDLLAVRAHCPDASSN